MKTLEQRISILEKKLLKEYTINDFEFPTYKLGIAKQFLRLNFNKTYKTLKQAELRLDKFVGGRMFVDNMVHYISIDSVIYSILKEEFWLTEVYTKRTGNVDVCLIEIRKHEGGLNSKSETLGSCLVDTKTYLRELTENYEILKRLH